VGDGAAGRAGLLEDSDLNVTDIAFRTGFGSLATFRRQFQAVTGTTPLAYRQTFKGAARPVPA
jgi:transcriptional regulator GlxA family with amidase domain